MRIRSVRIEGGKALLGVKLGGDQEIELRRTLRGHAATEFVGVFGNALGPKFHFALEVIAHEGNFGHVSLADHLLNIRPFHLFRGAALPVVEHQVADSEKNQEIEP